MTKKDQQDADSEAGEPDSASAAALAAAAKHAQRAIDSARELAAQAGLDDVAAKAAATATSLYREGRDRLAANEDVAGAADQIVATIRRNPLAAVGVAFTAGLILALLTRG